MPIRAPVSAAPSSSSCRSTTKKPTWNRASCACTTICRRPFPSPTASRSPTTPAPTGPGASPQSLAARIPAVRAVHLDEKGRGRALRTVWSASDAAVLAYMDVDLSTDLAALLPLVAPLLSGHSDVAIGSRLARSSRVVRGPRREFISRSYNVLLRTTLRARFSDAQCGFKAIRADCARRLLPLVEDPGWFFDTELLVLAERAGLRIHEVPVDWVDDPDSRVDVLATALGDLRGVARLLRAFARGAVPVARPAPPAGPRRARAARARGAGQPGPATGALRRDRRREHAGLPAALPGAARPVRGAGRQLHGAAADRRRQHGGEPPADVRGARVGARRAQPVRGPAGLRARARR